MDTTIGQAQPANFYHEPTADVVREDETFTRTVLERLKMLLGTVSEAHNDLGMLGERMFGGASTGEASGKGDQPSAGRASDVLALLERCQTQAARVASQARSLNVRI